MGEQGQRDGIATPEASRPRVTPRFQPHDLRRGRASLKAAASATRWNVGPATPDVAARDASRADPSGDDREFAALDGDDLNVRAASGHPTAGALIDRSKDRHCAERPRRDRHRNRAHADAAR